MKAAIYLRQSQDRTGEGDAVDRQREDCERIAHARGWDVVHVASDNDTSAAGKAKRPGFETILGMVAAGDLQVILAWDMNRLTRNRRDELRLIETGQAHRITLAFARSPDLDLSTPAGNLTAEILCSVARHEIAQKGDRQRRAGQQRRARGEALWTRRPFGYDKDDAGAVVVVEHEAAALRLAAELVLEGGTLASIVRRLDALDVRTSLGGPWSVTGLRRVLLNPRIAGTVTHHGQAVTVGAWPPILEPDEQAAVTQRLRDPRRRQQQSIELRYLLSGSARCGICGNRLYAQPHTTGGRRRTSYTCRPQRHLARRVEFVDAVVEAAIIERLTRPDAASLFAPSVDVTALRRESAALQDRRDALTGMAADGVLSMSSVREQAAKLTASIERLQRRIDAALGTSPLTALVGAVDVEAAWQATPLRSRRAVIDDLATVTIKPSGKGIRFRAEDVALTWKDVTSG